MSALSENVSNTHIEQFIQTFSEFIHMIWSFMENYIDFSSDLFQDLFNKLIVWLMLLLIFYETPNYYSMTVLLLGSNYIFNHQIFFLGTEDKSIIMRPNYHMIRYWSCLQWSSDSSIRWSHSSNFQGTY